jgi:hypothetical protein
MERGNSRASARGIATNNNNNNRKKNENNIKVISAGGCHKLAKLPNILFGTELANEPYLKLGLFPCKQNIKNRKL